MLSNLSKDSYSTDISSVNSDFLVRKNKNTFWEWLEINALLWFPIDLEMTGFQQEILLSPSGKKSAFSFVFPGAFNQILRQQATFLIIFSIPR